MSSESTPPPSMPPPSRASSLPPSRGGRVLAIVAVAVAVAGFFTGTRERKAERPLPGTRAAAHGAPALSGRAPAGSGAQPAYGDLRRGDFRANANLYAGAAEVLTGALPDPLAPVELTDEERARAVAARGERRAYDGAPPTIPHAVSQGEPTGCLVCHERGAVIAGKVAPAISHTRYASCLQCHVVSDAPGPSLAERPEGAGVAAPDAGPVNSFAGNAWGKGTRAWPGAPPTTPHPTWMRSECTSCHGVASKLGLRSSHPWRASCQQCHAPSAALDQRAPAALAGAEPTP